MYLSDAVRSRIKFYQKKKNMSLWALFKAVPISTLAAFMNKRTELIKLDTLLHICEGFGITLTEFFNDGIFADVELKKWLRHTGTKFKLVPFILFSFYVIIPVWNF